MSMQILLAILCPITAFLYILLVGTNTIKLNRSRLPLHEQCERACAKISTGLRKLTVRILKQGPVPQHIAFIMDGNRRFARKSHMATAKGHVSGFYTLSRVLEWCNDLGIGNVSVFAFAINNFNRSEEEVTALMDLAKEKLRELVEKSELVRKHSVCIRIIGNRALLPADVLESVEFAEKETEKNTGMVVNICFSYSATDEISSTIRRLVEDVESGRLQEDDIDEKCFESRLQIPGPDLDILVRTSGQIRFSNFMLWQSSKMAYIQFVDAYWPDFSFKSMLRIIVSWQVAMPKISRRKQAFAAARKKVSEK
ncbi:cis-prenyltransferase [Coemansia sp. RSA 2599]|nr:cis-prenyltransferase [Coemansia sp. RSA 2598]KAJ1829345.1 cis-prenyltransferase [Coemansia sp. RSA 2599]